MPPRFCEFWLSWSENPEERKRCGETAVHTLRIQVPQRNNVQREERVYLCSECYHKSITMVSA